MSQKICRHCGNIYYGHECDLCGPMEKTFARMKANPRERVKKTAKPYKREWRSGVDAALPPEKD